MTDRAALTAVVRSAIGNEYARRLPGEVDLDGLAAAVVAAVAGPRRLWDVFAEADGDVQRVD